jgi:GNAT superfamily N-acetyltransferase
MTQRGAVPWVIDVLSGEEWLRLRRLRERALLDAPDAFWATWDDERTFTPDQWRDFASSVTWLVVHEDSEDVALAGVVSRAEATDAAEVIGMWVDPARRGQGTARALLAAADACGLQHWAGALVLWVVDHNTAALAAYTHLGFVTTGETAPMPTGRTGIEIRMTRTSL